MTSSDAIVEPQRERTRLRALLAVLCVALALVVAGNSALAIALPAIADDLGADQTQLTWIIDAYALTFAALLLTSGIVADRVGRRTVLVFGLLVFGVSGLASAVAPNPEWLIALRALAGVGAAAIFPVTLSALVDAYPEDRRPFAVAVWSGVSAAGAVAGTIVAGALLQFFPWGSVQILFGGSALAVVPFGIVLVAQRRDRSLGLDPLGAVLSTVGLGGLVWGIIEVPERGATDPGVLTALALAVLGLVGFVLHELRSRAPSLDVRLFRSRGLAVGSVIVAVQFFACLAFFIIAPQYLQIVGGLSPLVSALALLVIPVGVGAGTAVAPRLIRAIGSALVGSAGLATLGIGFAILAVGAVGAVGADGVRITLLVAGTVMFGVGFGLAVTPGTVLILDGLPPERRSVASAVNDVTREVGGVLGIAALSSILLGAYRARVDESPPDVPAALLDRAADGAGVGLGAVADTGAAAPALLASIQASLASGVAAALGAGAVVLLVAAVVCAIARPRS